MLCQFYSFAPIVMWVFCSFVPPTICYNTESSNQFNHHMYDNSSYTTNSTNIFNSTNSSNSTNSTDTNTDSVDHDLSASSAQFISWIKTSSGDYANEGINSNVYNNRNEPNSVNITNDNVNENRREDDLGLPPDIANEYIDTVNPPKFRIPISHGVQYVSSSASPFNAYLNRVHAGSSVVSTKMNYSKPIKPNELSRNIDLAALLKAELDAKKAELDQTKSYTPAPNLFALLPGGIKTENPFLESNYKTPNRVKTSTMRPHIASDYNKNNYNRDNYNHDKGQFVYSEGIPFQLSGPSHKPTITITTPHSISIISYISPTKLSILRTSTTIRPAQNKVKIKTSSTTTTTTTMPTISTTTTTMPTISTSTTIANSSKQNKSSDWSLRVNNQSIEGSSNESIESKNLINRENSDKRNQSHEASITSNTVTNKANDNEYEPETNPSNKTEYNDFEYTDNSALNPNYTVPDGFSDHPGATYRLTTERLAYILIGSCCALSILCLIVVAMSVRCRDMCDEYRSWKKAEKAAIRWQRHQYRLAHHQQDLSRYFRTSVEANQESNTRTTSGQIGSAPAPMFGPTCCHCINCSSSWLFRDMNKGGYCCQRGYYHPAPRGKLPFGAASSVNTFMPRYANNTNNNFCDEGEDTDSLNASDFIDNHHINHHNRQQAHHFGERPVSPSATSRPVQVSRHQQLRRIAQPNGNPSWIHSSELVDELHKKHCNISHISRDQIDPQNLNSRARNRQHLNENVVVWNNNDERLI